MFTFNDEGYTYITIAVIGSVDASKSTTVGVLTTGTLDDGNGKARSTVFQHDHEHKTVLNSSISHQYLQDTDSKRILNFIDLACHESYLRTIAHGLASGFPNVSLICISDKITNESESKQM